MGHLREKIGKSEMDNLFVHDPIRSKIVNSFNLECLNLGTAGGYLCYFKFEHSSTIY